VLQWVQGGFPLFWLDFSFPAPEFFKPNNREALACSDFVTASISDLLSANAIMKWPSQPTCVSPLNVATKANGKQRLILDLRHVNGYLKIPKFRMDSLLLLPDLADLDDLMFALDLASGYHQVEMDPKYYTYLGFQWMGQFYVFKVLPFGLASAPWCFTKVMRSISMHLRFRGVRLVNYLDDFLFLVTKARSEAHKHLVLSTFEAAGLAINYSKSHLQFTRSLTHLGFIVDLDSGCFEVPQERWDNLQQLISDALSCRSRVQVHLLSKIAGHISSMILALGPIALIRSRQCHSYLKQHKLQFHATISEGLREELSFWSRAARTHFRAQIWPAPFTSDISIWCDAGANSWGATMGDQGVQAQGFFPDCLRHETSSSSLREMWGLFHSLESFVDFFKHKSVQIFTNNSNVVTVLKQGSTNLGINDITLRIASFTHKHNISLLPTWVPRAQNHIADALTHLEDPSDWTLNSSVFRRITDQWGLPTIDRFASHSNHLLPKFNSVLWCPGSVGINALSQTDWSSHFNWCFPPFNIIPSVISLVHKFNAKSIIILPFWPSSPWWPLLSQNGQHFSSFVHGCLVLPRTSDLLIPGPSTASAPRAFKRWTFLAIFCCSSQPPSQPVTIPSACRSPQVGYGI